MSTSISSIPIDAPSPPAGDSTSGYRFRAFMSYSHKGDSDFGPLLQSALERIGKPWYRLRALRIFRDDTDLAANPQLWPHIEASLGSSEFLLLLACPEAAASTGVEREIVHWTEVLKRDPKRILLAVTGGQLAWDEKAHDFDWSRSTAVPPALQRHLRGSDEPLWADFSRCRIRSAREADDPPFRMAAVKVAAALHGLAPRELDSEDLRQHRRTIRTFGAFVAGLVLLLAATVFLFAEARRERNEANRRARVAQSRALAVQAMDRKDKVADLALLLSVEAYRTADTLEARKALLENLLASPHLRRFIHDVQGVTAVTFHPTRPALATIEGGSLRLRDLEANSPAIELAQPGERYAAMRFFDDGATLAAARSDETLVLWDFASRRRIATIAPSAPTAAGGASRGRGPSPVLPIVTDRGIVVWDLHGRAVRAVIPTAANDHIADVEADPLDEVVAVVTRDTGIRLWDLGEGRYRDTHFWGHTARIEAVAFSPDGKTLASTSQDETTRLWSVTTGTQKLWWPKRGWGFLVRFSPDGRYLAWATRSSTVHIRDLKEDRFLELPNLWRHPIDAMAFGPGDRWLAVVSDGRVALLDLANDNLIADVRPLAGGWIVDIAYSPAGALAASASLDGELTLWDTKRETALGHLQATGKIGTCLTFSPDGGTLVTCGNKGTTVAWRVEGGGLKETAALALSNDAGRITTTAFRPDGAGVIAGDDGGHMWWWDAGNLRGPPAKELASVGCDITQVTFDPAGTSIASACHDGRVIVVGSDGKPRAELKFDDNDVSGVEFSADGRLLFSGGAGGVITWDLGTRARVGTPLDLEATGAGALAMAPTGALIASASRDGSLGIWDTATKALLGSVSSHGDSYYSVAFAPDGKQLAAGSGYSAPGNDALIFYDLDPESWARKACAMAARDLAPEERLRYVGEGRGELTCGR
jgi:WD40 repeat protein